MTRVVPPPAGLFDFAEFGTTEIIRWSAKGTYGRGAGGSEYRITRSKSAPAFRKMGFGRWGYWQECTRGSYAGSGPWPSLREAQEKAEAHERDQRRYRVRLDRTKRTSSR